MKKIEKYILFLVTAAFLAGPALSSRTSAASGERYLSRGEMAVMMSATDFMKEKISNLLNFAVGYNLVSLNRLTMAPIIRFARVNPGKVPPDGRTPFNLYVSVDDPGGLSEIIGVKADITSLGKLSGMSLVDNGLWGDLKAGDGIFTLQANTSTKIKPGEKEVSIAVANKKGWMSVAKTSVIVENMPTIISSLATPYNIRPDAIAPVRFTSRVIDPGGSDNIARVSIDLRPLGGSQDQLMKNDVSESGSIFALDFVPGKNLSPGVKKLQVLAVNRQGGAATGEILLNVVK